MSSSTPDSFDQLLTSHHDWLRSVVQSRVCKPDSVDDLVSDVMAEAIRYRADGHTVDRLAPWLYRVAVRKVLQFRRSSARHRRKIEGFSHEQIARAESAWLLSPLELTLGAERRDLVARAMERISGKHAEILTLKYVHGWKYDQIAERLGISKTKVTHRLRAARAQLKAQLHRVGLDEDNERTRS